MKARTKFQFIEFKFVLFRYLNLIPYLVIILFFTMVLILSIYKIFPDFTNNWTISFLSALIGAIIGSASSFYIMFVTRKNDNIDKIILEKRDLIYKPFFADIKKISSLSNKQEILDHESIGRPLWYEIRETDTILLLSKDMYRLLDNYYNALVEYRKQFIDTFKISQDGINNIIKNYNLTMNQNSIDNLKHEIFINQNKIVLVDNKLIIRNRYGDRIETEVNYEIIESIQKYLFSSNEYQKLIEHSNQMKKTIEEYLELFQYILKSIIYRFYRDNYPI